ncbi:hypothetical protein HUT06_24455 [Actinomadura sp. NAK00032]|uniref:hypothetical protein n=1 Tax=Actinomadura sp. NAK00032 TaxID=2742128 RepID=UPI001590486D|nr:hypothetical protein [Actinomadura sp. NAK00032]QKW36787.1 hypothetical protein HUT06_24455 [Actinomadura sp. NAK00032]
MPLHLTDVDPARPGLPWKAFTIPGSNEPVRLLRLEVDADGSSTSLVRFPPGWRRPGPGRYACGEEFVVLGGALTVSGVAYGPGDRGWIAPGATRRASVSSGGALALAWFSGVPAWTEGEGAPADPSGGRVPLLSVPVPEAGLVLRTGGDREARLYERAPARFGPAVRVLWPAGADGPRWTAFGPGEPLPAGRRGRIFVRPACSI